MTDTSLCAVFTCRDEIEVKDVHGREEYAKLQSQMSGQTGLNNYD